MSELLYLGLDYRTAPVAVRECFNVPHHHVPDLLNSLCASAPLSTNTSITEAAWLGTCNRVEIYAQAGDSDTAQAARGFLEKWLSHNNDLPPEALRLHFQQECGQNVVEHLCRVASGLDSMVLGEPQILGQVVTAHKLAIQAGTLGPTLDALFRKAIQCGKRVRTFTAIGSSAASIGYAAVELAREKLDTLNQCCVLVIGAGEMAQTTVRNLYDADAQEILVVNRSYERAQALAQSFNGISLPWDDLEMAFQRADIVICSVGAPHAVVHREMVQRAIQRRDDRPLLLIDIGVPRNVEPEVDQLEQVHLYDIDDLETIVQDNLKERENEVPHARALVQEATDQFMAWLAEREVAPTIRDLHGMVQGICEDQVQRTLNRLGPLSDREEQIVRALGHTIAGKLLHNPTIQLKKFAQRGYGAQYASTLRDLFDLESVSIQEAQTE